MRKDPAMRLLKWTAYTYVTAKALQHAALFVDRSAQDNVDAVVDGVLDLYLDTEKAIMALTNSPGASLNPSRQQARNSARAQTSGPVRTATTALLGSAGTEALKIGQWHIAQNEAGDLIGLSDDGRRANLTERATANDDPADPDGGQDTAGK